MRRGSAYQIEVGLLFVVFVWGLSPTLFKVVLAELDPLAFVFVRFVLLSLVSTALLALSVWRSGRRWSFPRRDLWLLVVSGLAGYGLYQTLYMVGLSHTTVFSSALLASTVPLWSAVLLAVLRIERIARLHWVGILVALAGVAAFLLTGNAAVSRVAADARLSVPEMLLGDVMTLVGAGLFAVYGIANARLGRRYTGPELMCYTLLVGTLALLPAGLPAALAQHWDRLTWHTWVLLPYSVIFPIYLTYLLWNWAITQRGVSYVTLFSYAVPVMSGLVAWLALGEALTGVQLAAAGVVLGGMLLARWGSARAGRARRAAAAKRLAPDAPVAGEPAAPSVRP